MSDIAKLADKLEARLHRDRHGKVDPELGISVDSGLCKEIFEAVAALRTLALSSQHHQSTHHQPEK